MRFGFWGFRLKSLIFRVWGWVFRVYGLDDVGIDYGVALVSRMDKITGLFCKRDL